VLEAQSAGGARLREAEISVGRPREEKADFWTAVGGQYKASIDYVVHLTVESGAVLVRGPEVRMQTVRTRNADGPAAAMVELHRLGGTVCDVGGAPVRLAWVALPDTGRWAATDDEGRFVLNRIEPGTHRVVVRTATGDEVEATVTVPGDRLDLVVGSPARTGQR